MRTLIAAVALLLPAAAPAKVPAKPAAKAATARPVPRPAALAVLPDTPQVQAVRRAFRFAFPIYEVMRVRTTQLARVAEAGFPNAVNALIPIPPGSKTVTTPNADTLYASAFLDLSSGPVELTIPPLPGRYHSAALMSLATDNTAILGTRTGGTGGRYTIVGPGYTGPAPDGTTLVRSATNDAWLLVRVLMSGADDETAATQAIRGFALQGAVRPEAFTPATPLAPDAQAFVSVVTAAIDRSGNAALKDRAKALGLDWAAMTPETRALWTRALPALRAELKDGLTKNGNVVAGWSYPPLALGDFGDDDDLRAFTALGGLAALPRVEAMYLTARTDGAGTVLDGSKSWRVKIPARMPVGGFWSVTMYAPDADGRLFFVPNELNRFAVGDRSKHLRAERDGSYELFVQAAKPSGERVVNWLPAPKGRFVLVFRAYLPRAEFLDGSFRLPPVEAGEMIE